MAERDYWLSLAVYDEFRGVPVRKTIARGYLDIRALERPKQALFIRLGSLFFQGRAWRKFAGHDVTNPSQFLTDEEHAELAQLFGLRSQVGAAAMRLLDDDDSLHPIRKEVTIERLTAMGFLDPDYEI